VNNTKEFKRYREVAMRSHVNSSFDKDCKNKNDKVDTIASLLSSFNLWNKNIPDMIRGYFDDFDNLLQILCSNTSCFF
jgi:hypothetical protein